MHASLQARLEAEPAADAADEDEAAAQPLALQLAIDVEDATVASEAATPDAVAP